ncbi:MAG: serine/threonine protein kinase [Gemmatimonadetes bacterium]|nr:serine/threonine protein kinase [Gemmatimonadota bacterium]
MSTSPDLSSQGREPPASPDESAFRERLAAALGEGFELRGPLGRGGFGVVYAAFDLRLKREVAVKALRPEVFQWGSGLDRFRREAEAFARLRHPHVMPIYSVGTDPELAYFIMPLVSGNLAACLKRERVMSVSVARRVLREAASALAAAHRAGLVHRDIKPDNIMLDGEDQRVLLTDFGIAKALGSDSQALTLTGGIVGSPHYMSPEQAAGDRTLDHRSDLYSLGVVGYEMLTGELPFTGDSLQALLIKQITEEPPPVTQKRVDCPADLAAAIARCLAKNPAERWGTADDLLRALEGGSLPAGILPSAGAAAPGPPEPLKQFRRLLAFAALAVLVLVVVDVAMGQVLLAPLGLLVATMIAAASYGRLWTAGYEWRDVLPYVIRRGAERLTPIDSAEFGPHAEAIRQGRSDRAAMLGLIQRLPNAQRDRVGLVVATVDLVLARATELARQLHSLQRQMGSTEALDNQIAATRSEPTSPSRNQRLAALERRRETAGCLLVSQAATLEALDTGLAKLGSIRSALERALETGLASGLTDVTVAVQQARDWSQRGAVS